MLDTLMALWNQGHLKKVAKILFTLALISMSIALLVVIAGGPIRTLLSHSITTAQAGQNQYTPTSTEEPSTPLVSDATATTVPIATPTTEAPTAVPTIAPAVVSIIRPVLCNIPNTPPTFTPISGGRVPIASPTARATMPVSRPSPTPIVTAIVPTATPMPASTPVVTPTDGIVTPAPTAPPIFDTPAPSVTPTDVPTDTPTETPAEPTPPFAPFPNAASGIPDETLGISNALTAVARTATATVSRTATPVLTPTLAATTTVAPAPPSHPLVRIGESFTDSTQDPGASHQMCGTQN